MTSPFDTLAATYAQQWSDAPNGRRQREQVWREIDGLFAPGSHVLDFGCGIGDDALHLTERGVRVTAIDTSPAMVAIARQRGVDVTVPAAASGAFDCILSNFGVFNCIADWPRAAREMAAMLRPGAPFALCVMPRYRLIEPRRWRGHTAWRGIDVYYRSRWETARAFAQYFELRRTASIGRGDHLLFIFRRRSA